MLDRLRVIQSSPFGGAGFLAGEAPPDPNPLEYDGRTKVLNVPSPMRVLLLDGLTRRPVAQTFSAADGTWRIDGIRPGHRFAVEFINDGQYTTLVGAEVLPVNSFCQDHVYAEPYGS